MWDNKIVTIPQWEPNPQTYINGSAATVDITSNLIVFGHYSSSITITEQSTLQCTLQIKIDQVPSQVKVSPNDKYIVFKYSYKSTLYILQLSKCLMRYSQSKVLSKSISLVGFTRDSKYLVTLDKLNQISIRNVLNWKIVRRIDCIEPQMIRIVPAALKLAVIDSSDVEAVKIWSVSKGQCIYIWQAGIVNDMCYTPDCRWVATHSNECRIYVWKTSSSTIEKILANKFNSIKSMQFTSNSKFLISIDCNNRMTIWNFREEQVLQVIPLTKQSTSYLIAFTKNENIIVSESSGLCTVQIWRKKRVL